MIDDIDNQQEIPWVSGIGVFVKLLTNPAIIEAYHHELSPRAILYQSPVIPG